MCCFICLSILIGVDSFLWKSTCAQFKIFDIFFFFALVYDSITRIQTSNTDHGSSGHLAVTTCICIPFLSWHQTPHPGLTLDLTVICKQFSWHHKMLHVKSRLLAIITCYNITSSLYTFISLYSLYFGSKFWNMVNEAAKWLINLFWIFHCHLCFVSNIFFIGPYKIKYYICKCIIHT